MLAVLAAAPALAADLGWVRAQHELRWAGDLQGGEPYTYRDPQDPARVIGFEAEIARGLARRLGVGERFVQNDWTNLIPSLERGDFDAVLNGIEDTPALRARCLVTRPYFTFSEQLVVRRGSRLRKLDDLAGRRVGTLASSLAHTILREHPAIETVLYSGGAEPYRDLELGRIDAVLLDSVIASRFGLVRPSLELADPDVARAAYVIALRRGDEDLRDALDAALADMDRSGELERIFARYQLPVLLQLFLLYYGIASLVHLSALQAAIGGLALNYGAYEAEVHRAAIGSIPPGQEEAAAALGLSRMQALRLVLLPQALRVALPAMTNDLIALLKDSSLVSVITVVELTKQMTITAVDVRSWAVPGLACAALYFAMSYPLARLASHLERRLVGQSDPAVEHAAAHGSIRVHSRPELAS
jgi:ABC-type amino acid transport system permease subunit